jgi:transcriptional regulator with XRE-family HTH domain
MPSKPRKTHSENAPESVSRLPAVLQKALEEVGESQNRFAARVGIDQSSLNQILKGKQSPGVKTIDAISSKLPVEWASRVWYAFLFDQIPAGKKHLVHLRASVDEEGYLAEEPEDPIAYSISMLPAKHRDLAEWVVKNILRTSFADVLQSYRNLLNT